MPDLKKIIKGCKRNKAEAQERLYEILAPKLMAICIRYVKNKYDAQDYLQEAFIRIFENIKSFKDKGSFEGWARRVTVNVILKDFQRKSVLKNSTDIDETYNLSDIHDDIIKKISHSETLNLLNYLPDGKKVIFNLYVIEGYPHKEIADMLGISEGTSKSQLSKAKEILQDLHTKANQEYAEGVS